MNRTTARGFITNSSVTHKRLAKTSFCLILGDLIDQLTSIRLRPRDTFQSPYQYFLCYLLAGSLPPLWRIYLLSQAQRNRGPAKRMLRRKYTFLDLRKEAF